MRKGPARKPTEIAKYQGNPGHRAKTDLTDSLQPAIVTKLDPPSILDTEARKEWRRVVPQLIKYRVLSDLDRNTIALYCQSWSDYLSLSKVIKTSGMTYESIGRNGVQIKPRPEMALRRNAWLEVIRVSVEFGFTPSSRAGLQIGMNVAKKTTAELLDDSVSDLDNFDFGFEKGDA